MKRKRLFRLLFIPTIVLLVFSSCNDSTVEPEGTISLGITDTRSSTQKSGSDIIDASKLTKFEVTISKIDLKTSSGGTITALDQETTINLRDYQGSVKDLASLNIPLGSYNGYVIYFSGITLTYDGNTYTSSVGGTTSLTLGVLAGTTFTTAHGVPNAFQSELSVDVSFPFELTEELNNRNLRIALDAVASCYEIEFNCTLCTDKLQYFVGLRPFFHMNVIFEEGIQQVKYSPPLGIHLSGGTSAEYYGIHTFIDFNAIGGTINSHTSQHVYRGEDGSLLVDAEDMATNSSTLTPNAINATGQTDVKANEVFSFTTIENTLSGKGYTLVSGKTYYFSLRKTWNITSGGTTYEITRTCEPIPVLWP